MSISNKPFKEYLQKELSPYILSKSIKDYVINLLCFYIHSEQLFEKKEGESKFHEQTLIEWYKKSQHSKTQEKLHLFKKMGDFSLYLSGFFREAIKKKLVHLSYYEEMGRTAYHYVSQSYSPQRNVFKELSTEFTKISEVLFYLQKQSAFHSQKKYFLNFTSPFSLRVLKNDKISH